MEAIKFSVPCLDIKSASFVYTNNADPKYIYRYNLEKFQFWEIKQDVSLVCEFNIHDIIDENIEIRYAYYFYNNDTLLFFIATSTADGLKTGISIFDPLNWQSSFNRLSFTREIKGLVTNIFVSKNLESHCKQKYRVMTIGTIESAIYIFRFIEGDILTQKKAIACSLLRTDARHSLTQEIFALDNVYVICGGFNGVIDFFIIKGKLNFSEEPILEYQRSDLPKLPSKLPIVSLQCLKHIEKNQILLAISQELVKPIRISRINEPSITVLEINVEDLSCKDMLSQKFCIGTHLTPLRHSKDDLNTLWTCFSDKKEQIITRLVFNNTKLVSKSNSFTDLPPKEIQHVYIKDENTCWMLDKNAYIKLTSKKPLSNKRSRAK